MGVDRLLILVMEQAYTLFDENNTELLCCFQHSTVVLAASWGSNIFGSGACGTEDVVNEWKLVAVSKLAPVLCLCTMGCH